VLFLDEPTSGVDPISRRSFWELIYELAAAGTTVLVTTHHLEEAEYCHRLALLNRGRLVALDTPAGLRAGLRQPLLEVRTAASARALEVLRDAPGVRGVGLYGRAVHARVDDQARGAEEIRRALAGRGIALDGLDRVEPSLEDVFVALVEEAGGAAVD
jgi:ABC-2 type transport system ATP-binding protein